jgi:hypothetical protein
MILTVTTVIFSIYNYKTKPTITSQKILNLSPLSVKKIDFIINPTLKEIYDKSIKNGKNYDYINGIDLQNNNITLNSIIDTKNFNDSINRLTESISLAYNIKKLYPIELKNIIIHISDTNGNFLYDSKIETSKMANILTNLGDGLDGNKKYELYDVCDLLPLIQTNFPNEYQDILKLKTQQSDIEILRNKGTTDAIFKNSKLYNLDKMSKNNIRNLIINYKLDLKDIDLFNNTIQANLYINTDGVPQDEVSKVLSSFTVLYLFTDFGKEINNISLSVFNKSNEKIITTEINVIEFKNINQILTHFVSK